MDAVATDFPYRVEQMRLPANQPRSNQSGEITLLTQVSMDRVQILSKTLNFWQGPVSLAIHIPVKSLAETLLDWQRFV